MKNGEDEQGAGEDRGMENEETGERQLADDPAPQHDALDEVSDDGNGAGGARCDLHKPVAALVPGKRPPGQAHRHRQEEQEDAADPLEFMGPLVGPPEKNLGHVEHHEDDHRRGPPEVEPVDQPAEGHFRAQVVQAVVSVAEDGDIIEELPDPRYDLQKKDDEGGAAEHVGVAAAAGHLLLQGQADGQGKGPPFIDPIKNPAGKPREHGMPPYTGCFSGSPLLKRFHST